MSFARSLVARGLVDQLALLLVPVTLGKGVPLFSDLAAPMRLERMDSKAFPGGGSADLSAGVNPSPRVRLPAIVPNSRRAVDR